MEGRRGDGGMEGEIEGGRRDGGREERWREEEEMEGGRVDGGREGRWWEGRGSGRKESRKEKGEGGEDVFSY